MSAQLELDLSASFAPLLKYLAELSPKAVFLVCGASLHRLALYDFLLSSSGELGFALSTFSDFTPNPLYESIKSAIDHYEKSGAELIIAAGGGSAIDVAKAVKYYTKSGLPILAIPTTAGTGSEATCFAVIHKNGEKLSLEAKELLPDAAAFWPEAIASLPLYQKKATMLDALTHSIESAWSLRSTEESRELSYSAIAEILRNKDAYLANDHRANANMLKAANLAGKAINLTRTTAGHAMSYKLTSLYGIAHGHAAALCVDVLWPYMEENYYEIIDPRGGGHVCAVMDRLNSLFGKESFHELLLNLAMERPRLRSSEELEELCRKVNVQRLSNHPLKLREEDIRRLYQKILLNDQAEEPT